MNHTSQSHAHAHTHATGLSVTAQIVQLPELAMANIKALWKDLFKSSTPTHNRQFLERRIAYQLQLNEFRKLDAPLHARNQRRIQEIIDSGKNRKLDRDIRLMPGTALTREYQGKEYRVTSTMDGQYEYEGRIYASLSKIAREITGTAWSGPVFFGVKTYASKKPTTKSATKNTVKKGGAK